MTLCYCTRGALNMALYSFDWDHDLLMSVDASSQQLQSGYVIAYHDQFLSMQLQYSWKVVRGG